MLAPFVPTQCKCNCAVPAILISPKSIRQVCYNVYQLITENEIRQVTRATHARNRVCPRAELILKIIIILLIIFLGFIKSKPC